MALPGNPKSKSAAILVTTKQAHLFIGQLAQQREREVALADGHHDVLQDGYLSMEAKDRSLQLRDW